MTSPLTEIQKAISEMREARSKATPGPWKHDSGNQQIEASDRRWGVFDIITNVTGDLDGRMPGIDPWNDGEFVELAANRMESILNALEKACEALELFPLSEKNRDRLYLVDEENLRPIIMHCSVVATEALTAIAAELKNK